MNRRLPLILVCLILIVTVAAPISAQEAASPAASMPESAFLYAEMQVSAEAEVQKMVQALSALTGSIDSSAQFAIVHLDSLTSMLLPGVSFADDVEPWLGDTIGYALFNEEGGGSRILLVFPAFDEAALAEHQAALTANLDEIEGDGDVKFYTLNFDFQMAILSDAVLIGTEDALRAALAVRNGEPSLMETDTYQRIWAQLPPDAALKFAVNGDPMREAFSTANPDLFGYIIEVAMRFNPATSETENALINADWYGGLGGSLDMIDNRLEFTGVALANGDIPAPELSSETAGAALLDYIPADAVLVFDSYDLSLVSIIGGLAVVGPAVNDQFNFIVQNLTAPPDPDKVNDQFNFIVQNLTAPPDPDKDAPQPPPLPPIEDLYAQFQPQLTQMEMVLGMDTEEVFETLSGEYAIVILPQGGESVIEGGLNAMAYAAWLQTSDPARVIGLFDTITEFLASFGSGSSEGIERQVESLSNGGEVITWHNEGFPELTRHGTLSDDVAFITFSEGLPNNALGRGNGVLTQSEKFPSDVIEGFGSGNEALLYVDMQEIGWLFLPNAADSIDSIAAAFDVREDGVFVLRVSLSFAEQ
jgi:hypothetical protein